MEASSRQADWRDSNYKCETLHLIYKVYIVLFDVPLLLLSRGITDIISGGKIFKKGCGHANAVATYCIPPFYLHKQPQYELNDRKISITPVSS